MSSINYDQPLTCSASRAIKSIFDGPNWSSNLLWLTIAALLQSFFVGSIFILGYGSSLLQSRVGLPGRKSPDIDSNRLGDYFMQGLWPFLVYFVASIIASIVITVPLVIFLVIFMFLASQLGDAGGVLVAILIVPLAIVLSILMAMMLGPITIRAMICQDFQKSFDLGWCVSFIKLTFKEVAISAFIFGLLAVGVYVVGLAMLCVGIIPAVGLLSGAAMHLLAQWYELFLSRGGEPVDPPADAIVDASVV
jgi:Protein of unknown function (DUF4013)